MVALKQEASIKPSTKRVVAMRANRESKGLRRWELSPPPHPDDRPAIREFADKLSRKRAKAPK